MKKKTKLIFNNLDNLTKCELDSAPIDITPSKLEALALDIATDWNGGIKFKDYVAGIKNDRSVKFYKSNEGVSYYNPTTKSIVIGYTKDDVDAFFTRTKFVNKKFAKELAEFNSTESYYKKLCIIHEYTHKYVDDLIKVYGNKEATILECYLMYVASENPIDVDKFKAMKDTIDTRVIDILDALGACPVGIRGDDYYAQPNHPRLQEVLANWAELTYTYPDMSTVEKKTLTDFIPKDISTCLNRIFRLRSLAQKGGD